MRPSLTRAVTFAALASLAAACQKRDGAPADSLMPPPPPPPPASISSMEIGKQAGPDRRVVAADSVFGWRDTLYLSVVTENPMPVSKLIARWRLTKSGQLLDSVMQPVTPPDSGESSSVTLFRLARPKRLPVGTVTVDIMLDGRSVGAQDIRVRR